MKQVKWAIASGMAERNPHEQVVLVQVYQSLPIAYQFGTMPLPADIAVVTRSVRYVTE